MPRYDNIEEIEPDYRAAGLRIGIVMSRFNPNVGEGLLSSCTEAMPLEDSFETISKWYVSPRITAPSAISAS